MVFQTERRGVLYKYPEAKKKKKNSVMLSKN